MSLESARVNLTVRFENLIICKEIRKKKKNIPLCHPDPQVIKY